MIPGSGADADDVRAGQRVAQHRLEGDAGHAERHARQGAHERARQAQHAHRE
jgi:hypothetical protein